MKSPFPGMDPFLETPHLWAGFHGRLIEGIYRSIAEVLPSGYFIDTGVRRYTVVTIPEDGGEPLARPKVTVGRHSASDGSIPMQAFLAEKFKEPFVEIFRQPQDPLLMTCIEVLSPSNKRSGSEGWHEYNRKRQAFLLGRANFIEIDLLRGGQRMPMLTPWPDSPYTLLVSRAASAPRCRAWPAHFRSRLPPIPVPLLEPEADLTLDLQPLIDHIYSLGRYNERIDYSQPLSPALPDNDATWVREVLAARTHS